MDFLSPSAFFVLTFASDIRMQQLVINKKRKNNEKVY